MQKTGQGLGQGFGSAVNIRSAHLLNPNTKKWEDADAIPDLGRIGRQQAFLREIGARAMSEAMANPFTANDIADRAVNNLTVDQDFGRIDVFVLADGLAGAGGGGAGPESQTVPAEVSLGRRRTWTWPGTKGCGIGVAVGGTAGVGEGVGVSVGLTAWALAVVAVACSTRAAKSRSLSSA